MMLREEKAHFELVCYHINWGETIHHVVVNKTEKEIFRWSSTYSIFQITSFISKDSDGVKYAYDIQIFRQTNSSDNWHLIS